jgi:hypothetical protein
VRMAIERSSAMKCTSGALATKPACRRIHQCRLVTRPFLLPLAQETHHSDADEDVVESEPFDHEYSRAKSRVRKISIWSLPEKRKGHARKRWRPRTWIGCWWWVWHESESNRPHRFHGKARRVNDCSPGNSCDQRQKAAAVA